MIKSPYKVKYLPLFEQDFTATIQYISHALNNPTAALDLIDRVEEAILARTYAPLPFEPYYSLKDRAHTYYRIYVGNYIIFYTVIDDTMEVRRFLYGAQDLEMNL